MAKEKLNDLLAERELLLFRGDGKHNERLSDVSQALYTKCTQEAALEEIGTSSPWLAYLAAHDAVLGRTEEEIRENLASGALRCFILRHHEADGIALGITYVALRGKLCTSLAEALTAPAENEPAAALTFCSVVVDHPGLRGLRLAENFIAQVAGLAPEEWDIGTLSPVPGFRPWLENLLADPTQTPYLESLLLGKETRTIHKAAGTRNTSSALTRLLKHDLTAEEAEPLWLALRKPLQRLCLAYLTTENAQGKLIDPVAELHLGIRGAALGAIQVGADLSPHGMAQSYGLMVNYITRDNQRYTTLENGIKASAAVHYLAEQVELERARDNARPPRK